MLGGRLEFDAGMERYFVRDADGERGDDLHAGDVIEIHTPHGWAADRIEWDRRSRRWYFAVSGLDADEVDGARLKR